MILETITIEFRIDIELPSDGGQRYASKQAELRQYVIKQAESAVLNSSEYITGISTTVQKP